MYVCTIQNVHFVFFSFSSYCVLIRASFTMCLPSTPSPPTPVPPSPFTNFSHSAPSSHVTPHSGFSLSHPAPLSYPSSHPSTPTPTPTPTARPTPILKEVEATENVALGGDKLPVEAGAMKNSTALSPQAFLAEAKFVLHIGHNTRARQNNP